jgi:hypothetical protein
MPNVLLLQRTSLFKCYLVYFHTSTFAYPVPRFDFLFFIRFLVSNQSSFCNLLVIKRLNFLLSYITKHALMKGHKVRPPSHRIRAKVVLTMHLIVTTNYTLLEWNFLLV